MTEDWQSRWEEGRTGWHEAGGNSALREYWLTPGSGARVLVPLCGKSPDLLWLAQQGYEVTGVELSEIAVHAFFEESDLEYKTREAGDFLVLESQDPGITLVCGDYFNFESRPFDALYDRASLIALSQELRPHYIRRTKSLLKPGAEQLLITLEYDQSKADGPPFSVLADEVADYWNNIELISTHNAIDNTPPKFREAGITEVTEAVWRSRR